MLIPLRVDVHMWRRPWVNYALMAMIVLVSVEGFYNKDFFVSWAGIETAVIVPKDLEGVDWESHEELWPLVQVESRLTSHKLLWPALAISSSFLHGGWLHLIGNMLFLWVFGNAINYKFGHLGYAGLYLLTGLCGGLAHYGLDGRPYVGASGAINGVVAAFLVFFPRNDVTVLWLVPSVHSVRRISSVWLILFWFAWDVLFLLIGARQGVALWAHVAGFLTGLAVAMLCAAARWIRPTQDELTILEALGVRQ